LKKNQAVEDRCYQINTNEKVKITRCCRELIKKINFMRKIIVEAEISMDGIVHSPEIWPEIFKYHTDDVQDYLTKLLFSSEAILSGRLTYEIFAKVWPTRTGKDADYINKMPKYVASRTLKEPLSWNSSLIQGDVVEELRKLKRMGGKDLVQYGVGELTHTMLNHGLVDRLQLLVFPFTFGKGGRWFDSMDMNHFKLIECKTFKSGAVLLDYEHAVNSL
jgi:dihydrofolate reductase